MSEQFTVEIAGRLLAVELERGTSGWRAPFARLEVDGPVHATAELRIRMSRDPEGDAACAGLGIGRFRGVDGSYVCRAESPVSVQSFRLVQVGHRHRAELDMLLSPAALESGDLIAQPAHNAVGAWLSASGNLMMHAAGVSAKGRGLLLIGDGGHGKTTTAIAACQRGFRYLGDDLCVVSLAASAGGVHQMHGIYATAKLNHDSRERLGILDWHVIGTTPKSKAVALLPPHVTFERSVPIAAIVHVGHEGTGVACRRRLSEPEAWKVLAHASIPSLGVTGTTPGWLRAMMTLARDIPAFSMPLDWNLDRAVRSLEEIAEGPDE